MKEEDTIPHFHLPNTEKHYADLKITEHRKSLHGKKTMLAVSQESFTKIQEKIREKNASKVMQSASPRAKEKGLVKKEKIPIKM